MEQDLKNAVHELSGFLEDPEKRIFLLKGYDNDAKILASLVSTNRYFKKCILLVNVMKEAPRLVNDAFPGKQVLPNSISSNKQYRIGKMQVAIYSYVTSSQNVFLGNKDTCTIIYPVQTALDDESRYKDFLEKINMINSKKIILITSNEWSIDNWDIENIADEIYFYDVENDNPDLMKNLRNNQVI